MADPKEEINAVNPAVSFALADGVATLTLNRPEKMNALDEDMLTALETALLRAADHAAVRAVVITGAGRAFCAGGDLAAMRTGFEPDAGRRYTARVGRILESIMRLDRPVVAAVNGAAFGAGANLALACDLVVAGEEASFCQAHVRVGLVSDAGGSYILPRLCGLQRAKELVMTGRVLSSAEAAAWGLATSVVPTTEVLAEADRLARTLADGPAVALGLMKSMFNRSLESGLSELLEMEACAQGLCLQSADHREGLAAFFAKRAPRFRPD